MLASTIRRAIGFPLSRNFSTTTRRSKEIMSDVQEKSMSENCFLVSRQDKVIGTATKKDCHKVQANGNILLHRAFSLFLFNSHGDLLLQKRSAEKVS